MESYKADILNGANTISEAGNLTTRYLGLTDYADVWDLQKQYFDSLVDYRRRIDIAARRGIETGLTASEPGEISPTEYLLLTEHKPVITMGRHAKEGNVLASAEYLSRHGISLFHIERGGDVTYHGPGQLVAYPVIDLRKHHLGVKQYVNILEETVIRLIENYGLKGERIEGASGVWIGKDSDNERKIAAVGVKCSHFVTMHGIALNVNTDLSGFSAINPCGFVDKGVTSIARETGVNLDIKKIAAEFDNIFRRLLCDKL